MPVDVLAREDSVELLLQRSGDGDRGTAEQLGAELGDLSLALLQAAAYVDATAIDLRSYLSRFRSAKSELLASFPPSDYSYTVATTWALGFEELEFSSSASMCH